MKLNVESDLLPLRDATEKGAQAWRQHLAPRGHFRATSGGGWADGRSRFSNWETRHGDRQGPHRDVGDVRRAQVQARLGSSRSVRRQGGDGSSDKGHAGEPLRIGENDHLRQRAEVSGSPGDRRESGRRFLITRPCYCWERGLSEHSNGPLEALQKAIDVGEIYRQRVLQYWVERREPRGKA